MSTYYDPTINLDAQAQQNENKLVNLGLSKMPVPHISGLKLQEDVSLGNLVLNRLDPSTGVVWVLTDLKGWWNLPDSEFPDVARGWGDGSYDASGRYAARILTLEGSFLTQTPDQVAEARAKLMSVINLVYRGADLIVRERVSLTATQVNEVVATDLDATGNTITIPAHGLTENAGIVYNPVGTRIPELLPGVTYYVKTVESSDVITLSASPGGSAINFTQNGLPPFTTHSFNVLNNSIIIPSHGLVAGDAVTYTSSGASISGLVSGRTYYVKTAPTVDRVTLSATSGGSTVAISGSDLPSYTKHTFTVTKPKVANVRISGKPQIETVNARGRTDFSIGLKAANPLKYEYYPDPENGNYRTITLTRGSSIVVRNAGDARVPVIFMLSGNTVADGVITNTANGATQSISGIYMEISDSRLEIDTYNRNIIAIDGSNASRVGRVYASSYVDWIQLEPGDNTLLFESTDTAATCVMYYKSGWLG